MKTANVKFYRIHKYSNVCVELIVTLEADNEEEAVEKGMAAIRDVLPHDELFANGAWRWDDDADPGAEVEWLER